MSELNELNGVDDPEAISAQKDLIADKLFRDIDNDRNGYLSKAELERGKQSTDESMRKYAGLLLDNFDLVKKQSNDEWFSESQVSKLDVLRMVRFRDDPDTCSEVIRRFDNFDLNKDGFIGFWEHHYANSRNPTSKAALFFNQFTHGHYKRMEWMASLSNDSWGPEEDYVSLADLRVFKKGADFVRTLDNILSSAHQQSRQR